MTINFTNTDVTYGQFSESGNQTMNVNVHGNQTNVTNIMNSALDILRHATCNDATYDSGARYPAAQCFPGTRKDVLAKITEWIEAPKYRLGWLHGVQGAGKSTIAQSIAELCVERQWLAASFFFSSGRPGRSNGQKLFPSIAYQLMIRIPELKGPIEKALDEDPSITDKPPFEQLKKLIVEPLLAVCQQRAVPTIVIVDSIHECDNSGWVKGILSAIIAATTNNIGASPHFPLKFLFTSQRESYIETLFKQVTTTNIFPLQDFSTDEDLLFYLKSRLTEVSNTHPKLQSVPKPWPSPAQLEQLVKKSSGQFLYAFTAVAFIDKSDSDPVDQLNIALGTKPLPGSPQSPNFTVDPLYSKVLSQTDNRDFVRIVINSIVLLYDSLSLDELDELLHLRSGDTQLALSSLHSVFYVPPTEDPIEGERRLVQPGHSLFREFLTNEKRAGAFFANPPVQHASIAHFCLRIMMKKLRVNICAIENMSLNNRDVSHPDISTRCNSSIDHTTRYSCSHWSMHLLEGSDHSDLFADLRMFASLYMLQWLETLSLLGQLDQATPALRRVQTWLQRAYDPPKDLLLIFREAEQFVSESFEVVWHSALKVYPLATTFHVKHIKALPPVSPARSVETQHLLTQGEAELANDSGSVSGCGKDCDFCHVRSTFLSGVRVYPFYVVRCKQQSDSFALLFSGRRRDRFESADNALILQEELSRMPLIQDGQYFIVNCVTGGRMWVWVNKHLASPPISVYPSLESDVLAVADRFTIQYNAEEKGYYISNSYHCRRFLAEGPKVVHDKQLCRIIPVIGTQSFYISTDMNSNPPLVISDPNSEGSRGALLRMGTQENQNKAQMWCVVPA